MCTRVCLHKLCAGVHARTHVFSTRGSQAEGSASLEDSVCSCVCGARRVTSWQAIIAQGSLAVGYGSPVLLGGAWVWCAVAIGSLMVEFSLPSPWLQPARVV